MVSVTRISSDGDNDNTPVVYNHQRCRFNVRAGYSGNSVHVIVYALDQLEAGADPDLGCGANVDPEEEPDDDEV